jgi:hypothetical protein
MLSQEMVHISPTKVTPELGKGAGHLAAFPRFVPRITTSRRSVVSRLQIFLDVPASKFALPPDRSYRCTYCCRAAGDFTSGPIVLCCLHTHRIC